MNNFKHFDRIGQQILNGIVTFVTYHDNSEDEFGWFDGSGTTYYKRQTLKSLFELKCNHSRQDDFDTTIITKADLDKILANTPDDVTPFYVIFTNKKTYIHNLRKIANDPDVFYIEEVINKRKEMADVGYRSEEWVFINRHKAKKKGYLKRLFKGGLSQGINIDVELAKR